MKEFKQGLLVNAHTKGHRSQLGFSLGRTGVGTSMNAVLIQIWTALITILLLKTLQREAKYPWNLSNLVAFVRLNLFVKIDLKKWLDKPFLDDHEIDRAPIQLSLF